ncbi:MAG: helix-turn-helix domain-containing protein [Chitinivibrionia bacterium]|nr:helix-turn-helix domain-containing protein [Chitinivibrionia bacterium]
MQVFIKKTKERLILFCKNKKIKQIDIARLVNVSADTVRRWLDLDSDYFPSLLALKRLKDNYGLELDWLVEKGELL